MHARNRGIDPVFSRGTQIRNGFLHSDAAASGGSLRGWMIFGDGIPTRFQKRRSYEDLLMILNQRART